MDPRTTIFGESVCDIYGLPFAWWLTAELHQRFGRAGLLIFAQNQVAIATVVTFIESRQSIVCNGYLAGWG